MTLKPGLGSLKVIENYTIKLTSYERSIVTIGLSRTVSEINGDIRRKLPIFPTPVYLTPPMKGIGYRRKTFQMFL